jgi:glycosyltransferase involved in cell wall biosynthesis
MSERCVAVLGWRDEPTDAVEEYCRYLGGALATQGITLEIIRVPWPEMGWSHALQELRRKARGSRQTWFLLQYTALGWSRRGFPLRALNVIRALKKEGARCAVVFHDPEAYPGNRLVDKLRRAVQLYAMRKAARLGDLTILTVPREQISWIPGDLQNVIFIPVGANLPNPEQAWHQEPKYRNEMPTVAVFSISGGALGEVEVRRIVEAMRYASGQMGPLRLLVLGRNSEISGKQLREQLAGSQVGVVIHGLLEAEEVVRKLGASDVLLFARGPISTRRGSAIAGIACGLPVVACGGGETAPPITEAGVVLLPEESTEEFGPALVRVLINNDYRASLRERSRRAQRQYFSWDSIAASYITVLRKTSEEPSP